MKLKVPLRITYERKINAWKLKPTPHMADVIDMDVFTKPDQWPVAVLVFHVVLLAHLSIFIIKKQPNRARRRGRVVVGELEQVWVWPRELFPSQASESFGLDLDRDRHGRIGGGGPPRRREVGRALRRRGDEGCMGWLATRRRSRRPHGPTRRVRPCKWLLPWSPSPPDPQFHLLRIDQNQMRLPSPSHGLLAGSLLALPQLFSFIH